MNIISDEVIEAVTGMHPEEREYPDDVRKDFQAAAEWARKEALREAEQQVRDYWDACGELIDSNNGARLAFEAVAEQIAEWAPDGQQ